LQSIKSNNTQEQDQHKFLNESINSVVKMNCIDGMKMLPSKSIDLILADPPYNLSKGNVWKWDNSEILPGMGGNWNKLMENWDDMSFKDYLFFTVEWLKEAKRILKPTGSIWACGTYHNIGVLNVVFQILGIEIINEIIWYKRNAFPNLSGRRFTASHENILWGHAGGKKRSYLFRYDKVKQMEFPYDNMKKKDKQMRTVWDIPNNKTREEIKFGSIPSQKPLTLIHRIIESTSNEGNLCLVPFCGSGSECIGLIQRKRDFIAFENNEKHFEIAQKRLQFERSKK